MRDIKFRAWDKKNKEWISDTDSFFNGMLFNRKVGSVGIDFWSTKFELMQYTGLKDKNGKEIYEGDITKEEFNSGIKNCEVVFESGGFFIKNEKAEILDNLHWHSNGLVVIGNIHENPELLEVTK